MPDRDYLGNGRTRGWGAAINLLSTEGVRTETVTASTRALAAELRRAGIGLEMLHRYGLEWQRIVERDPVLAARLGWGPRS